ncbi:SusF/SusE family outer membrane protein [Panacibacter sp. DH6]|uniref:SusF/SusE family outer membrane protein n=1 Tax=Panacibacter microcysteis TaxID=2793269 RepID=A0A931E6P8_9BACT|nr:SusF/SusE family outer membrane protein [Panacibacter microcysteis]MBG9377177.1 SusF/SusE family outer membrane protein [Panacibacter microcysteis]
MYKLQTYIPVTRFSKFCLLLLLLVTGFTACKKELDAPTPFPFEAGNLVTSKDTVVIDAANPGNEAMTLTWDAFANSLIGNKVIITYGEATDTVSVASGATNKKFTNGELNNILVDNLGMAVDIEGDVQFTLLATITTKGDTAMSNTITVKITPAPTGAAYAALWIVGNATPNGWNIDNPNQMRKDPTNAFQFKYNEVLNAGEFKIPTTTGNWGTDYFMPPTNHPPITSTEVQLIPGGNPDNKWQIDNAGAYKILLNISSSPFIHIVPFTPYAQLWMVGDATPAGWNIDAPVAMVPTPGNVYEFTYTGTLNAGEFKIPTTTGNWGTDYFMPATNGEGINSTDAVFIPGGNPDNKWKITEAGIYKVTINQLYETIKIEKQ